MSRKKIPLELMEIYNELKITLCTCYRRYKRTLIGIKGRRIRSCKRPLILLCGSMIATIMVWMSTWPDQEIDTNTPINRSSKTDDKVALTQAQLDELARTIVLNLTVVENSFFSRKIYQVELKLTNTGHVDLPGYGWEMIFSQISLLEPGGYPYPHGVHKAKYGVRFFFLMGNVYRMVPTEHFGSLKAGTSRIIKWVNEFYNVALTDNFPNWYLAAPGLQARVLESTRSEGLEFVSPHDTPATWKRVTVQSDVEYDFYDPFTAQQRMSKVAVKDTGGALNPVLPSPADIKMYNPGSTVTVTSELWVVASSPRMADVARYLAEQWNLGQTVRAPTSHYIQILEEPVTVSAQRRQLIPEESYKLRVDPSSNTITIRASEPAGAFYGVQSLIALTTSEMKIPETDIHDGPRYRYRGLMVDVARNFFPKEVIFRLIDLMGMYKLNKLHLHLTDDEGWRLAIPGLEELTEIGGTRCHDLTETKCLLPFLGSGPFPGPPGSGFYTVEDYRAILRHARSRHVEVIPEIDIPGHSHAAIRAMEVRYKRLADRNITEASRFLLSDLDDKSMYRSVQSFVNDALNPCLRSTYNFISRVLNSLYAMHRDISPLRVFHFGGDEVAGGAWRKSPVCNNLKERGLASDLHLYLASHVANMTSLYNLDIAAWEEGFLTDDDSKPLSRDQIPNRNVYIYAWNNVFEWGTARRAYDYANAGYKVIMSPATHLYLDHPYEPDPLERGLYWAARYTDTRKVFEVNPEHTYWNAKTYRSGKPMVICRNVGVCPPLRAPHNIEGIQASLFGELIRTQQEMDFMLLPRLLAAAERAWHAAPFEKQSNDAVREEMIQRDWDLFANTLGYRELARLDRLGYRYRIPPPGATLKDGVLKATSAFPGLQVEMSEDAGVTWTVVNPHGQEASADKQYLFRTKAAWGTRYSRAIPLHDGRNRGQVLQTSGTTAMSVFLMIITFIYSYY